LVLRFIFSRLIPGDPAESLFVSPRRPYTRALPAVAPHLEGRAAGPSLPGESPSLKRVPSFCRFHPGCALATAQCRQDAPVMAGVVPGHGVACHRHAMG